MQVKQECGPNWQKIVLQAIKQRDQYNSPMTARQQELDKLQLQRTELTTVQRNLREQYAALQDALQQHMQHQQTQREHNLQQQLAARKKQEQELQMLLHKLQCELKNQASKQRLA